MDPTKGVIRWSARRARRHLQAVVTGAVVIPLSAVIAGLFIAGPPHPTAADRVVQAVEALGVGFLIVITLALIYAIFRAPYEQRKALRIEIRTLNSRYDETVDEVHKGLTLSDISVQRDVLPENPHLAVGLSFHLRFRNDTNIPLEYSMRSLTFHLGENRTSIPINPNSSYRVWPNQSDGYLFSVTLAPPLATGFEGSVEYTIWKLIQN